MHVMPQAMLALADTARLLEILESDSSTLFGAFWEKFSACFQGATLFQACCSATLLAQVACCSLPRMPPAVLVPPLRPNPRFFFRSLRF